MEPYTTHYIYDDKNKVIEIRTRIMMGSMPRYIIQYPHDTTLDKGKIKYTYKLVDEIQFYS
jgi:hypothetical protein